MGTGGLASRGSRDAHRGPEGGRCRGTTRPRGWQVPGAYQGPQGTRSGFSTRGAGAVCQHRWPRPDPHSSRTSSEGSQSQVWDVTETYRRKRGGRLRDPGSLTWVQGHNPRSENVAVLGCIVLWPQECGAECPRTGSPRNNCGHENGGRRPPRPVQNRPPKTSEADRVRPLRRGHPSPLSRGVGQNWAFSPLWASHGGAPAPQHPQAALPVGQGGRTPAWRPSEWPGAPEVKLTVTLLDMGAVPGPSFREQWR